MSNTEGPVRTAAVGTERRLTAILATDVKGYSRLMGEDEVGTLRTLTAYRKIIDTLIEQHRGRIVGTAGDSVLAEFASVVDAVQCAVVIQTTLKVENANLPSERKMEFRLGINLGDVMVEGEQIYGDGVNIAARLESLADPGGICISGTVHEHIKNKLSLQYENLGEQTVKNIAEPVRVLRVMMKPRDAATANESVLRQAQHERLEERRVGTAHLSRPALVVVELLIAGALVTILYPSFSTLITRHSSLVTQEAPALPLPDKPSIAVLPFVNMSNDPEQEYFSDGLTEDLITELAKLSGLFVIARNSVFTYKGKAVKVQEVGRELGVRYVLEGSVRKAGNKVLINAQLIDAPTGHHVWAERYDRELKDIFALQEEIRRKIVSYLAVRLTEEEQERAGMAEILGLSGRPAEAIGLVEKAMRLNPQYPAWYLIALGRAYRSTERYEEAVDVLKNALTRNPNLLGAHIHLAAAYSELGREEEARAEAAEILRLSPNFSLEAVRWGAQKDPAVTERFVAALRKAGLK